MRLLVEYEKYGKLYVAFDFDNTIFDYHNNGGDYSQVINLLKECSELGFTLILFTSNDDVTKHNWMKEYCSHFSIKVDYVNENPIVLNTKKPYYNILLDDRAGLESAWCSLSYVVETIKRKQDADIKSS